MRNQQNMWAKNIFPDAMHKTLKPKYSREWRSISPQTKESDQIRRFTINQIKKKARRVLSRDTKMGGRLTLVPNENSIKKSSVLVRPSFQAANNNPPQMNNYIRNLMKANYGVSFCQTMKKSSIIDWNTNQIAMMSKLEQKVKKARESRFGGLSSPFALKEFLSRRQTRSDCM